MTSELESAQKRELFVGAIELALLDRIRQEYVDNMSTQTLFVIDFPNMAHIHCVPPLSLSLVETTGFLSAPRRSHTDRPNSRVPDHADYAFMRQLAKSHSTALGLTEVLARFVFDRSWSDNQPKLMLPSQTEEASSLEAAILNAALAEWADANSQSNRMASVLQEISRVHRESVSDFVNAVIAEAEKSLPELYGEYSRTRQHLRFSDVKPLAFGDVQSRPVMFAHAISEVRQYLDELNERGDRYDNFAINVASWQSALQRILPGVEPHREARRTADAKTLATIEFLNGRFSEDQINCRVVYLTSHSALTDVAALHFKKMSFRDYTPSRDICGSRQSFSRTRYNAWLLTDLEAVARVPILDPRALMTDRRFVEYAISDAEHDPANERRRAITEWLPLFFNGDEQNPKLLADSYFTAQRVKDANTQHTLNEENFDNGQYTALIDSWDKYIKTISAGYGLSRYAANSNIQSLLQSIVNGNPSAITAEIKLRLEQTLREWLPAVGGATFFQMKDISVNYREIARSVPPLIMPAFEKMQRSLLKLLGDNRPLNIRSDNDLNWLKKPNANNLGLPDDWDDAEPWRLNYVHSLGLAYGFAIEENWTASFRLAEMTYSMATGSSPVSRMGDSRYISGREAAFLRSFSARRRLATRPLMTISPSVGRSFIHDIKRAWATEMKWFADNGWQDRASAHHLRIEGEQLAWRVFELLYGFAMRTTRFRLNHPSMNGLEGIEKTLYELERNFTSSQDLCTKFESVVDSVNCENLTYYAATFYLARQSLLAFLQLMIFASPKLIESERNRVAKVLISLEQLSPERASNFGLKMPWAHFEQRLIFIGSTRLGLSPFVGSSLTFATASQADSPVESKDSSYSYAAQTLNSWRENTLFECLTPTLQ